MDVSKLSFEQLHAKLRAIKQHPKKPYLKYPEEVSLLVKEAFNRGMSPKQIQSMSEMPEPTLRYIYQRIRKGSSVVDGESKVSKSPRAEKGFITIKVKEDNPVSMKRKEGEWVCVKVDASGLTFEIGLDSLTPNLLQALRSII